NAFTQSGRTEKENDMFDHIKTLAEYRTSNKVMQTGKLTQFIPENGTYVYFRHNDQKAVMVVFNNTDEQKLLETARFDEIMNGYDTGVNILNGEKVNNLDQIELKPRHAKVLELH
ncbi:MAG: cyclomaltodextrinase C-terminal domain-containing protein, partial [Bacteroidales bacterium]|nr:cyclomaltodextrinase C-terminal domain-containing protein [Bacteroidales bacterium]